ncbi:hypothetical protein [Shinella sp.]|uniref:hypothetical protein n=1 Tax=Shinella sp. TaxID=1870904 RepID=UPI003F6EAE09
MPLSAPIAVKATLAELKGDFRGLLLADRLADDLLEVRLDRTFMVGIDFKHELFARRPFLQRIGAAADQLRGDRLFAERFESLPGEDAAEPSGSAIV